MDTYPLSFSFLWPFPLEYDFICTIEDKREMSQAPPIIASISCKGLKSEKAPTQFTSGGKFQIQHDARLVYSYTEKGTNTISKSHCGSF